MATSPGFWTWSPLSGYQFVNADLFKSMLGPVINPVLVSYSNTAAQTLLAADLAQGGIIRTTQSAARTDTTDTASNLVAASQDLDHDAGAYVLTYVNNGTFPITLAGGTGVTITNATVVPANSWVQYLMTRTSATAVAMAAIAQGSFPKLGTWTCNGATPVTVADTRVTAGSIISFTLKTVGGTVSPNLPAVLTITAGTGFTAGGTASDTSVYNYEIRG